MGDTVAQLRNPRAIRERAGRLLALAETGTLEHFAVDGARLGPVAERVIAVARAAYPDLSAIPYHSRWRHFSVGGVDRAAMLDARLSGADARERLRARLDLVITSVLLDAGAGAGWTFREPGTGQRFARSEGLAVASFHLFASGGLSSAPTRDPLRADAAGLAAVDEETVARAFQVDAGNSLVGVAGRASLLRRLGETVAAVPQFFPAPAGVLPRVGHLGDFLFSQSRDGTLEAPVILGAVLAALGPIWPGRHTLDGVNLGDVWPHPQVGLVPLHKLSQWLTYSLLEPLLAAGLRVTALEALTGLAEYRNGGLMVDGGVLRPKHAGVLGQAHAIGSPLVVEWRGLTVALLDRIADQVRARLGMDAGSLPLAKVLEGGTWSAGRALARELRPDGSPPICVQSDGTVF